jgi:hypothetical protein
LIQQALIIGSSVPLAIMNHHEKPGVSILWNLIASLWTLTDFSELPFEAYEYI